MALGIFALAVVGLLAALDTALDSAREIRNESRIRAELNSRLAMLETEPPQELSRVVESTNSNVKFTESMTPEVVIGSEKQQLAGFWRVRIVAEWPYKNQTQKQEASFLRYSSQ